MEKDVSANGHIDSKAALREQLAKLDLAPDQTQDDIVRNSPRDQELLDNVPPHHHD